MKPDTQALVENMIQGDQAAFDELYRSYSGKMYRMACFITGSPSDSEDILQETFVKCYLNRERIRHPELFESWLSQILVRTAWKSAKKRKEVSLDKILDSEESAGLAERIQQDDAAGPLERVLQREQSRLLLDAVETLDMKYRTVIFLYYYDGMSTRQIAKITGTLEGTVKSRLFKARSLLKKQLQKQTDESACAGRRRVQHG